MREGWEYKKFEECINKMPKAKQVKANDYGSGSKYPIISQEDKLISGYYDDESFLFHIDKPLVVFGDHTRVLKYIDFDFVVGADGVKILSPKDNLNAKFLLYFLQWYKIPNLGYSRHYKLLKEIDVPLPPKSVQLEIVSELDQINELIRLKKEQLKDYDKLAQSIFYEMFGDPVENESRESKNYKLIELCENKDDIKCGPFGTQLSKSEYVQSGVPVWGIPQINSHFQEPPTCFVSNLKADSLKDYSVKWGDIVMSRKGSVGLCCVFPKNMSSGILHSDVIRLRFDEKMVDSIFMMHYLHFSSFIRHQIKTISHGAIMAGLNVTKLKSLKVILPPLPLQQEFSSCISQIERQKAEVSNAIADLETLLASRMQYWFE